MRLLTNYEPKTLISPDGLSIYYEVCTPLVSKGRCIIFLHGFGGDLTAWDQERITFKDLGYTTIALDLRGHGLSQRGKSEDYYTIDKFGLDVIEIIKQENLVDVTIAGHCLGGIIALTIEALYPKSTKALIVVDSTYKPAVTSKLIVDHKLINKFFILLGEYAPELHMSGHTDFTKFIGTDDINIRRFLSDIIHTSFKNYFLIYRKFITFDVTTLLTKITVPTLIVEGTSDTIFSKSVAKNLHKRIKTSELEFIKGANHIIVLNNPMELVKTIYNFLQKVY